MSRRILLGVLLIAGLLLGACSFPSPVTPTQTGSPASATVPPASTAAATATIGAPRTSVPAVTPATASAPAATRATAPAPAATRASATAPATRPSPTAVSATAVPGQGVTTFTSTALGIRFTYLSEQQEQRIGVREVGDKIYVYPTSMQPEAGQWVRVFRKPAAQSLDVAVRTQLLQGYAESDCRAALAADPIAGQSNPPGRVFARIEAPARPGESVEARAARTQKCPQPYAAVGGIAYFMADTTQPDRFVFFSIGQYAIMSAGGRPWQNTVTLLPLATVTAGPRPTGDYLDNRSSPEEVLRSYANALNHKVYAQAFSYWWPGGGENAPTFAELVNNMQGIETVQIQVRGMSDGAAAGSRYWRAAALETHRRSDGTTASFDACYTLRLADPQIQAVPPFQPLGIVSAELSQSGTPGDCLAGAERPVTPQPAATGIGPDVYIDNRTAATDVLRSLFNAVNRKEYVRAFAYWRTPPAGLEAFQQGYADTALVEIETGAEQGDSGAGRAGYRVPVALHARTIAGAEQHYGGCYVVSFPQPGFQSQVPFQTLAIDRGQVSVYATAAQATAALATACAQ